MIESQTLSVAEIEALLKQLQTKHLWTPPYISMEELEQHNPELAESKKQINAYCKEAHGTTALNYFRQIGLIAKTPCYDTVPAEAMQRRNPLSRPDSATVNQFKEEFAPQEGLFEACGQDIVFDSFECNLNTQQEPDCIDAFGMLEVGDCVELRAYGAWGVEAFFCDKKLGYIEDSFSVEHNLTSKIRYAEHWGALGGKVYAQIVGFRAVKRNNVKQKSPQAVLFIIYAIDMTKQNSVNSLLLSADSRSLIGFVGEDCEHVVVPDGVEEIVDWAFYERGVSSVTLPDSLRAIGQEAFARTRIDQVEIPKNVETIGLRSFVRGFNRNEPGKYDTRRWEDDGPTRYEVAAENERFEDIAGSLVEIVGNKRILRSVYYEQPSSFDFGQVSVPEGIDVLGEGCLVSYSGTLAGQESDLSVEVFVPDGVESIEDGWSCTYAIETVLLPSSKVKMSKETKERLRFAIRTRS